MTLVVSAFPGTGKSTFYNKWRDKIKISDSDSSNFSKDQFPANYIAHIKKLIDENYDVVLVSSHEAVRKGLKEAGIDYTFVLPYWDRSDEHLSELKSVYMQRYKDRGSPQVFLDVADRLFETWIKSSYEDTYQDSMLNYIFLVGNSYLDEIEGFPQFLDQLDKHGLRYLIDVVKPLERLINSYGVEVIRVEGSEPLSYNGENLEEYDVGCRTNMEGRSTYDFIQGQIDKLLWEENEDGVKAIVYRPLDYSVSDQEDGLNYNYKFVIGYKTEK